MTFIDRLTGFLVRRRKARHARWLRRNRVLLAPDRAVRRDLTCGWWS